MNKKQILDFNRVYSYEPTAAENQLITDMISIWAKLEPAASKNPSAIRKGIVFGMGLMLAEQAGEILLPPIKKKASGTNSQGGQG